MRGERPAVDAGDSGRVVESVVMVMGWNGRVCAVGVRLVG